MNRIYKNFVGKSILSLMVFDDEYLPSPLQTLSNIPKQFMLFSAILKRNLMYYSFNNSELVSAIMVRVVGTRW